MINYVSMQLTLWRYAVKMVIMTTKATLYIDTDLYKAIKLRAVESGHSISNLMNDALRAQLNEDLEDINSIRHRLSLKEKPLTYEQALQELRDDGRL